MGVKERDPWRVEPDLPPPAPEHHVDGLGEKLTTALQGSLLCQLASTCTRMS